MIIHKLYIVFTVISGYNSIINTHLNWLVSVSANSNMRVSTTTFWTGNC